MPIPLLWQDDKAVIVNKPAGLLVHNSAYAGPKEVSLRQLVSAQIGQPVFPVHRLDRATSGAVLFVRQREWAQPWQEALNAATSAKFYLALVRGRLTAAVVVDHPIREAEAARTAVSRVWPLTSSPVERCCLVGVQPLTGRKHQVRRHLAHLSHPIIGDTTYGKGEINRHYRAHYGLIRLALHAQRLEIAHPFTGVRLRVDAPLPEDLARPWQMLAVIDQDEFNFEVGMMAESGRKQMIAVQSG